MKFKYTKRETFEKTFIVEAENEEEAAKIFGEKVFETCAIVPGGPKTSPYCVEEDYWFDGEYNPDKDFGSYETVSKETRETPRISYERLMELFNNALEYAFESAGQGEDTDEYVLTELVGATDEEARALGFDF